MNRYPSVSVVIPAYNVEHYVAETIESVRAQTISDWELIIIDDGSTDKTYSIAQQYVRLLGEEKVTLIHQENSGLSASRNRGLACANGEYVYFLDADDTIKPTALADLLHKARENNLDIVLFSSDAFSDKLHSIGDEQAVNHRLTEYQHYCDRLVTGFTIMSGVDYLIYMVTKGRFIPSVPFALYRRHLLGADPFIRGILFEDNPFTITMLIRAKKVGVSNEKYYNRRIRSGSIMQSVNPDFQKRFISRFIISEAIRNQIRISSNDKLSESLMTLYSQFVTIADDDYVHIPREERRFIHYSFLNNESSAILDAYFTNKNAFVNHTLEIDAIKTELEAIRHSYSYRIGVALTSLPRAIKRVVTHFIKH